MRLSTSDGELIEVGTQAHDLGAVIVQFKDARDRRNGAYKLYVEAQNEMEAAAKNLRASLDDTQVQVSTLLRDFEP